MPPKKSVSPKKKTKKVAKPPLVIAPDSKLPAMHNERSSTILYTIANSDISSLKRLVTHYNYKDSLGGGDINGSTSVHLAVKKNNINILKQLFAYGGVDVNAIELPLIGGQTALHHACNSQSTEIVRLLLENGANPNIKSKSAIGETPLHLVCKLGSVYLTRMLLDAGADPDVKDNFGNNASFWAYKYRNNHLINEACLPGVKSATAEEFLKLQIERNPTFKLPPVKKKHKKGATDKKKKKAK